jgi:uncharacterized membrane protein
MGLKDLSKYYQDNEIHHNAFSGVIFYIIASIALGLGLGGLLLGNIFPESVGNILRLGFGLILFFAAIVIAFIFFIIASMRIRRAMQALAHRSGQQLFETAGLLFLVGSILTIVLVGLVLLLIGWLLALVAFFSIKTPEKYPQSFGTVPLTPTVSSTRYCPYCGVQVDQSAIFCPQCGRQLPPN